MVCYAVGHGATLFDPAVGAGAFLIAAKRLARSRGKDIELSGTEICPDVLAEAKNAGLSSTDLADVDIRDFVLNPPDRQFPAIVANPPYLRHHRIGLEAKRRLKDLSRKIIGKPLDGRTGYHVFFFLRALKSLRKGGRLAFIMPADTCEGTFANTLWKWIFDTFRLDAVITFAPEATPFPGVDTNAMIFMISAEEPTKTFVWAQCKKALENYLSEWVERGFPLEDNAFIEAVSRGVEEGFSHGLSRRPRAVHQGLVLGHFVRTLRGIATGDNDLFFMTGKQAADLGLPREFLVRAVGRTRDVVGPEITQEDLTSLDRNGRPTFLLSLDGRDPDSLPDAVKQYLESGERKGTHERALIKQRHPWYKMEKRAVPPFLFAYLGRRQARFIRNKAGVVPLTGFLCIYPLAEGQDALESTWQLLSHPETISNLSLVGKSYGSGAIKVEPRALERLPITDRALRDSKLSESVHLQLGMAFASSS